MNVTLTLTHPPPSTPHDGPNNYKTQTTQQTRLRSRTPLLSIPTIETQSTGEKETTPPPPV